MFKRTLILSIMISSLTACGAGNSSKPDSKKALDLQSLLDTAINSKDAKDAHITGIPLTFQCNGFNNNKPVSLSSGKISDQVGAPDLPTDAIYQIASSTKSFTAVVALQLEAEGYFGTNGLDSKIGDILGNPASSETWNALWNQISMRQLLNMTSGIPDYVDDAFLIYSENPNHYFSTEDLISLAVNKKPDFQPGQGWTYSNTNYAIMNKIISHVTNSTLKKQITTRIINKLGLTHTYYVEHLPTDSIINPTHQAIIMSSYYTGSKIGKIDFGTDLKLNSLSITNAAGSILSNTSDMNTYVKALFANKNAGGLLAPTQLNELKYLVATENTDKYKAGQHIDMADKATRFGMFRGLGYGLGIMEALVPLSNGGNITVYTHGGDMFGFDSNWIYQENTQASTTFAFNAKLGKEIFDIRTNIESKILNKISNECVSVNN